MIKTRFSSLMALAAVLTLGLAGSVAIAQTKTPGVGTGAQHRMGHGHFGAKLGLSEKQIAQIREIRTQSKERAKAIWANDNQSVGALKNALKTLREDTKSKINSVLTPEQRAMMEKAHSNGKGQRPGKSVPPPSA